MKYPQLVSMPSAVSDWLEEQLEARGIDAVVYTRYVLSLLYRDPIDIICPDQDLHFTNPNKEVRRSGGGRKRFCRSTDYWGHAHADTDQLKRSAAVECLKSASDQKCGIESLVDELCEKLKEIKSEADKGSDLVDFPDVEQGKAPVQDPAKRYYAAFPALSRNSSSAASPSIITLIPKWFGSPKKKGGPRRQNRSSSYEEKLHFKVDTENMKARSAGKQRFNYFARNKKDLGYCRSMSKSIERPDGLNDWDFFNNNNCLKGKRVEQEGQASGGMEASAGSERPSWDESEETMYDDLPVDIRDLLDSPTPQDVNVEMMNIANMRDTGNNKFIQCGTNIISSIWSNDAPMEDSMIYDNTYNTSLDNRQTDSVLDFKFSSISIDRNVWSTDINMLKENEANSFFESCTKKSSIFDFKNSNAWSFEKWADTDMYDNDLQISDEVSKSLLKLNHDKDQSSFTEVKPRSSKINNIKSQLLGNSQESSKSKNYDSEKDKEDLLISVKSHFRPINEKVEGKGTGHYVDGTTFVIPSSLDKVNFKRSESGTMCLEAEYGMATSKRYMEYKKAAEDLTLKFLVVQNDKACQTGGTCNTNELELTITPSHKKAESMGRMIMPFCGETVVPSVDEADFYFPGDRELLDHEEISKKCTCVNHQFGTLMKKADHKAYCLIHTPLPDDVKDVFGFGLDSDRKVIKSEMRKSSDSVDFPDVKAPVEDPAKRYYTAFPQPDDCLMAEIFGKFELKCDKCNSNGLWTKDWSRASSKSSFDRQSLSNIWSGGEVCMACLALNNRPTPSQEWNQLREDITQDGEQLLSDLSSLQKTYMEELPFAEVSCNLNDLIGSKEWKQSVIEESVPIHSGSFSFATRLQEDCLLKMATIPTLRSVTL